MFTVKIDDSQLKKWMKESPQRSRWALREALSAAGGHVRKGMVAFIRSGGENWPPLAWEPGRKPLQAMAGLVRFRVTSSSKYNRMQAQVGFFWGKARGMTPVSYRAFKQRFRSAFGMTPARLAKLHEQGYRKRVDVTPEYQRFLAAAYGIRIRGGRRTFSVPARPIIEPVWRRYQRSLPGYVEKKFFARFLSNEKPALAL